MNKKLEKTLLEMFGEPIDPVFGTKVGDVKGIADVGAVGVRDVSEDIVVCPACGEMPIDGQCACDNSDVCPMCGQMPPKVDATCSCGLTEGAGMCGECGMNEATCECGTYESELEEVTPKGYEDVVKSLKKEPDVDNPWAVAWSMKKKGIKPKK